MKRIFAMTILALAFAVPLTVRAAPIVLNDVLFNLNGTPYHNTYAVPGLDSSLFNSATGLGTLRLIFSPGAAGAYNFDVFFDHQLHAAFTNESGAVSGAPPAGVSWQIDVPSTGTIFANTSANTLDNTNHVTSNSDVSMALGFNFILAANEFIDIVVTASQTAPGGGFFLQQIDPDTPDSLYLSQRFSIIQGEPPTVPEPGIWLLVLTGLALMTVLRASRERVRPRALL